MFGIFMEIYGDGVNKLSESCFFQMKLVDFFQVNRFLVRIFKKLEWYLNEAIRSRFVRF